MCELGGTKSFILLMKPKSKYSSYFTESENKKKLLWCVSKLFLKGLYLYKNPEKSQLERGKALLFFNSFNKLKKW